MMGVCLDFTKPDTLKRIAALPFYGYAEALIRRVDPFWHAPEPPYSFKVHLGKGERCRCCGQVDEKSKTVIVEARDADDAERVALADNKGWFVAFVDTPKFPTADVPEMYLKQFEKSA